MDRTSTLNSAFVVAAYIVLMNFGFVLNSRIYLDRVEAGGNLLYVIWNMIVFVIVYTPSNLLLVSVLACYIGSELGRSEKESVDHTEVWRRAAMNGVVVFATMFFASGWLDSKIMLESSQEYYFKLSAAISAMGFYVGLNPTKINDLVSGKKQG